MLGCAQFKNLNKIAIRSAHFNSSKRFKEDKRNKTSIILGFSSFSIKHIAPHDIPECTHTHLRETF